MSFFSRKRKKKHSEAPSTSTPASGLASSQVTRQLQFPTKSQSHLQSPQVKQQSWPLCPWSAFGPSSSPFFRGFHALYPTATVAGELFLFGGYVHSSESPSNDLYLISTRNFSVTHLQTSGDVPSPRYGHRAVLTSTILLIWGGWTGFSDQKTKNHSNDDSFYLLNLGTSYLLMSRPVPADQSLLYSSIARMVPRHARHDQWSRARWSGPSYHDAGRFQAFRIWWLVRQEVF